MYVNNVIESRIVVTLPISYYLLYIIVTKKVFFYCDRVNNIIFESYLKCNKYQ